MRRKKILKVNYPYYKQHSNAYTVLLFPNAQGIQYYMTGYFYRLIHNWIYRGLTSDDDGKDDGLKLETIRPIPPWE